MAITLTEKAATEARQRKREAERQAAEQQKRQAAADTAAAAAEPVLPIAEKAAEAIAAGLFPLLPDRLAYPELIRVQRNPQRAELCLFDGTPRGLAEKLEYFASHRCTESVLDVTNSLQSELTGELAWPTRATQMDAQIEGICASSCPIG